MSVLLSFVLGAMALGSDLQLFVDDTVVESMDGVRYELQTPVPRDIAIRFDKPWEGFASAYLTVFKDGDKYRGFYRGLSALDAQEVTCTAESVDGIVWTKPELGIIDYGGSTANNAVWTGPGSHSFFVFLDTNPAAKPEEKYKAIGGDPLLAFISPDGYHWNKVRDEPIYTEGHFDSLNTVFWNPLKNRYEAFLRDWPNGTRSIRITTSTDFLTWSPATTFDFGSTPAEHLYTNAVLPYFRAPNVYLGFPKRFSPDREAPPQLSTSSGVSDAVFMSSRDGIHWKRWGEAFIRPGLDQKNWTHRNMMTSHGILETAPGELSLYVSEHYMHDDAYIRRYTVRTDGFVSVSADATGGTFVTKPFTFTGRELILNYSTSAAGSIRVQIETEDGKALPAFGLTDCDEIYGDHIERAVTWVGDPNVSTFGRKTVRLRFQMKDADLFSFRFR